MFSLCLSGFSNKHVRFNGDGILTVMAVSSGYFLVPENKDAILSYLRCKTVFLKVETQTYRNVPVVILQCLYPCRATKHVCLFWGALIFIFFLKEEPPCGHCGTTVKGVFALTTPWP